MSSLLPYSSGMGNQLQEIIKYKFMSKMQTSNPILDAIIHMLFYSSIATVLGMIPILSPKVNFYFTRLRLFLYYKFIASKIKEHSVQIEYITDNKQINELHKAVSWYLSNNNLIDFSQESTLKFVYDKPITKEHTVINKVIVNHEWKKLTFKNEVISYYLTNNLITIYGDKERKRENYTIYMRAKSNVIIDDFCQHCVKEYATNLHGTVWTQKIYVNNKGVWEESLSNNRRRLETIALKESQLEDLVDDVQSFIKSKDWYHEHDIPYTRGYLLFGPAGVGKTSIIKGISNYDKRHIHYLNLSLVADDNELITLLKNIKYEITVLVIEDLDCMIDIIKQRGSKDGDNVEMKKQLEELKEVVDKMHEKKYDNQNYRRQLKSCITLSGLLNAIDGVFNNDGRILIVSTNHPEVLDVALLRPGRIDRKYHLSYCDRYQIAKLYSNLYGIECDKEQLDDIKEDCYSPAFITGLFLKYKNTPHEALLHINDSDVQILQSNLIETHDRSVDTERIFENNFMANLRTNPKSNSVNDQLQSLMKPQLKTEAHAL